MQGKRKEQIEFSNKMLAVFLLLSILTVIAFVIFSKI